MNAKIKKQIIEIAESSGQEVCGFIYFTQHQAKLYQCENIAKDKASFFEISADDYLECLKLGEIYSVYHSHVKHRCVFSSLDVQMADETLFPLYLYSTKDKKFDYYLPNDYEPAELIGRSFIWGFQDCYGLFRDYLTIKKGISLKDYDRDEDFREFDFNIIDEELPKEGFCQVESKDIKEGDLITFRGNGLLPKHLAIYMNEGKIMHHPIGKLSIVEDIGSWAAKIDKIWRLK